MSGLDGFVKLLLHCDGADGSTTFTDASDQGHSVTAFGDAQVDTAQSKFGGASALLDGDDALEVPDSDDWTLWDGDSTVDFWVRFGTVADMIFLIQSVDVNNQWFFSFDSVDDLLVFNSRSAGVLIGQAQASFSPSTDTWYHIAFERHGNDINMYVNGTPLSVLIGDPLGSQPNLSAVLFIAASLDGWVDEVRISKGIARYKGNSFTPPSSAYSFSETPDQWLKPLSEPLSIITPRRLPTEIQLAYIDTLRAIIRRRISLGASHQGTVYLHGRHRLDAEIDVKVKS